MKIVATKKIFRNLNFSSFLNNLYIFVEKCILPSYSYFPTKNYSMHYSISPGLKFLGKELFDREGGENKDPENNSREFFRLPRLACHRAYTALGS